MASEIRHLNCATMHPKGGFGGRLLPPTMVAHCLLVVGADGLTLVDTGFGTADLAERRMGRAFATMMGLEFDTAQTALAQVEAAGFSAEDVADIAVTHLDLDHAGGLGDFPSARVHVFADELAAAQQRRTVNEKQRYLPAQWAHGPHWVEHRLADGGEDWLGFSSVRAIGEDVVLVPLHGHTRGHCGVAVRRPSEGWFLHAGDSYFNAGEKLTPPSCPSGLRAFQNVVQVDGRQRRANQERLRSLHAENGPQAVTADPVTIFSAHDVDEFADLADVTD